MINVGDRVACYSPSARTTGTIEKVGRTLIHVRPDHSHRVYKYDRLSQQLPGDSRYHFRTLEQVAQADRQRALVDAMRRHGLRIIDPKLWTWDQIAALVGWLEQNHEVPE